MSEFARGRGRPARGARSQRLREARAAKNLANQPEIVRAAKEQNLEEIRLETYQNNTCFNVILHVEYF